jgi:hypothetical protein
MLNAIALDLSMELKEMHGPAVANRASNVGTVSAMEDMGMWMKWGSLLPKNLRTDGL